MKAPFLALSLLFIPSSAFAQAKAVVKGKDISGIISFAERDSAVMVTGDVTGLKPGEHGIHIHEKGDCSAPDFSSAGSHCNPGAEKHGGPKTPIRHLGDLGNIHSTGAPHATLETEVSGLMLDGENSIIGRSVVIHEKADDLQTDPAGNSGARIACGVIESGK